MPNIHNFSHSSVDIVFCLEVFEHLPEKETLKAIQNISKVLKPNGYACIGVPNEVYIAAMIKGLFRMTRRYGDYDANFFNIIRSSVGFPPKDRPISRIEELAYYSYHMGFDYRNFKKDIGQIFKIEKIYGSPIVGWPNIFNFEVYFLCKNKK